MDLTREAAERAMTAFAVVAAGGNSRHEAEPVCLRFLTACIAQLPRESDMAEKNPNKVDASKENARLALEKLTPHVNRDERTAHTFDADMKFVKDVLEAATKRLPSQKAIDRDRKRKRKPAKKAAKKPAARPELVGAGAGMEVHGTETFRTGPHAGHATEVPAGT